MEDDSASPSPSESFVSSTSATSPNRSSSDTTVTNVPAPPQPFACSDRPCCTGMGQACDSNNVNLCQGLVGPAGPTPPSVTMINHPGPTPVQVCGHCERHGQNVYQTRSESLADRRQNPLSHRAQLCHDCVHDEMVLYWLRQGTPQPAGPPSIPLVARWPVAAGGDQNLCICAAKAITPYLHHCHACRTTAWERLANSDKRHTDDILGDRVKRVVTGHALCDANGGALPMRRQRQPRQPRVRLCPCGRNPKSVHRRNNRQREFITYCLACMGVRVVRRNIPPHSKYQQRNMTLTAPAPPRRSERLNTPMPPQQPFPANTKGLRAAPRSHLFRVNIERAWVPNDPLVGGTY